MSAPTLDPVVTAALPAAVLSDAPRISRRRRFLMCRPTYFSVSYAINPWMTPGIGVDGALALQQWEGLRHAYEELGHTVEVIDAVPGLPDMVFAANGAFVLDGVALGARFAYPQRAGEASAYREWLAGNGIPTVHETLSVHEGEGDLTFVGGYVLAGTGFRTELGAHADAQEVFGHPVISLRLVDPRFYHLDTALFPLDDDTVAYYPEAFSSASAAVLRRLFPDALLATRADAEVLGLNSVSDGRHVVLPAAATALARAVQERGYVPVPVELDELLKGGGGPKCCTMELRPPIVSTQRHAASA